MKKFLLLILAALLAPTAGAQPQVVAHRGYWTIDGVTENTTTSFEKAAEAGCHGSEFDVWLTADNRLIVHHDRTIKTADIDIDMERDRWSRIRNVVLSGGERIPTVDAHLDCAVNHPEMRIVIELKRHSDLRREDKAVELIVKQLKQHDALERADFISFSMNACIEMRKAAPEVPVYYLNGDLTPESIKALGFAGFDYKKDVLRRHPEWIARAHELGLKVNVWTVDSEEDMRYFIGLGVDYITTNYPEKLQKLLK